ncbi:MAG: Swt1 family HEPN domain-containing protein [Candidatus Heimdallarchaeota archaeon]
MSKRNETITEIRKSVMKKLRIKSSTLSNIVTKKVNSLPISIPREYALYIIAKENNIHPSISDDKRERLNEFLIKIDNMKPSIKVSPVVEEKSKKKTSKSKDGKTISINVGKFSLKKTNLKPSRINEAYEMTELYFYLNIFENSIRFFVFDLITENHGINWWDSALVKPNTKEYVVGVKKSREKGWLRTDEPHPLFYTTFGQLFEIIDQNWSDFKHIFKRKDNLKWFINPIKDIRNPIAHNNVITKNNKKLLLQHIQQWFEFMDKLSK